MPKSGASWPAGWWEDKRFLAIVVVAMAIPLFWPTIPPLTDLMGHMGRYRVQLDLDHSLALQSFYGFRWQFIGNLGADLLVVPLSAIFGLEFSVKLIVIAIPVFTAVAILWISAEVHGRASPAMLLALPFAYGHPFTFGFLNFTLGMAMALNAFAFWLYLERHGRYHARACAFVAIGFIVWITHSFAWGVLGLLCFSAEVVHNRDRGEASLRAIRHAALHCLALAPPLILMILARSGAEGETGDWFSFERKLFWLVMALRDRWQMFDILSVFIVLFMVIFFIRNRHFTFSRNLAASGLTLLLAFVILPRIIFGSAYADMRLIPFIFIVLLVAVRPVELADKRVLSTVAFVALAFFIVRIGANTASFFLYDRLHTRVLAALDHIPRGARLVTFVGRSAGIPWYTDRTEHIPALAIVRREAFSNDQWVMKGAQLLSIRKSDARGFDRDPTQLASPIDEPRDAWRRIDVNLARFPRHAFDYLWLIKPPPFDRKLLTGLEPVWSNETGAVYRVNQREQPPMIHRTASVPARQDGAQRRTPR